MDTAPHQRVIISVGGSLIVPDDIGRDFLRTFRDLIKSFIAQDFSFFIIAGGGKTARRYQSAAQEIRGDLSRDDLDWIGIHATRLNAHLLRTLFREEAYPRVIKDPASLPLVPAPIMIGAGTEPGWSTDYIATLAARSLGAHKLVNLTNIDFVYTGDPRTSADAVPIKKISWRDFRALVPPEWDPGLSSPFDPVAAREAQMLGLEVAVINGRKIDELGRYLRGKTFEGTVIS